MGNVSDTVSGSQVSQLLSWRRKARERQNGLSECCIFTAATALFTVVLNELLVTTVYEKK